ncbi:MAG: hypothetical protein LBS72_02700 [Oscillospiraceae bacterium]|jgi:hypothetical protein|nr:hypothetical protein [Oscillospiraceae bacterium]
MRAIPIRDVPDPVYTPADAQMLAAQLRARWIAASAYLGVSVACLTVTLIARVQWATMVVSALAGGLAIFLWGMKVTPVLCYRRHLRDIGEGLSRSAVGRAARIDEDVSLRDGIECYAIIINIGDPKNPEDERLYYWDAQKGAPPFSTGDKVEITSHGNDIIGFRVAN